MKACRSPTTATSEDKPPLFDSVDTILMVLAVNTEMIAAMEMRVEKCLAAASDPMLLATDLADAGGVAFHSARLVRKAVAESVGQRAAQRILRRQWCCRRRIPSSPMSVPSPPAPIPAHPPWQT